jgi:hypothetical protein
VSFAAPDHVSIEAHVRRPLLDGLGPWAMAMHRLNERRPDEPGANGASIDRRPRCAHRAKRVLRVFVGPELDAFGHAKSVASMRDVSHHEVCRADFAGRRFTCKLQWLLMDERTPAQVRTEFGISQEWIAHEANVGRDSVRMYEANPAAVGDGVREACTHVYRELALCLRRIRSPRPK